MAWSSSGAIAVFLPVELVTAGATRFRSVHAIRRVRSPQPAVTETLEPALGGAEDLDGPATPFATPTPRVAQRPKALTRSFEEPPALEPALADTRSTVGGARKAGPQK